MLTPKQVDASEHPPRWPACRVAIASAVARDSRPCGGAAEDHDECPSSPYAQRRLLPRARRPDRKHPIDDPGAITEAVTFHTEFLDLDGGPRGGVRGRSCSRLLRLKYGGRQARSSSSPGPVGRCGSCWAQPYDLFPGVRSSSTSRGQEDWRRLRAAGRRDRRLVEIDWRGTLEAALQLQPQTKRVVVVRGTTDIDRLWIRRARERSRPTRAASVHVSDDLPMGQLLKKSPAFRTERSSLLQPAS
jgi:hypothetical protein